MISLLISIHILICILLIIIILIQAGRGGGLVESFAGVESMFGTKTNAFLTRLTTILASLFFVTCVGLAVLSARQSKSLMRSIPVKEIAPIATESQQPSQENVAPEAKDTTVAENQVIPEEETQGGKKQE